MPEVPTPGVNGQVVSSPALHASMSISSLAPAARMLGWAWSTATAGSFCLFWENGLVGLPTDTRVSPPWVAEATTGMTRAATKATNPATKMCRPERMAPSFGGPAGPTDVPASHPKKTPPARSQLRPALPAGDATAPAEALSVIHDAARFGEIVDDLLASCPPVGVRPAAGRGPCEQRACGGHAVASRSSRQGPGRPAAGLRQPP